MNWLLESFVAMLLLVPAWLAIGFFDRNFGAKGDVFVIWYCLGIVTAAVAYKGSLSAVVPSVKVAGAIYLIGLTIGAAANILLFRAAGNAPNPGLAVAISNVAAVGVFLAALLLARYLPKYFATPRSDGWSLLGVLLVSIGAAIIAARN
jgi:hypothetical protein